MEKSKPTGIYFLRSLNGHPDTLDYKELETFVHTIPEVKVVWNSLSISFTNKKMLASVIHKAGVERVVIAGYSPGLIKSAFSEVMATLGYTGNRITLAGFREHGANSISGMEKAKAILYSAVNDIPFSEVFVPEEYDVIPETLVVGGGIAGIQASLEIANAGYKVYLLERSGTIGGHMAMFDKTFPTLDCAACILTPKMVEVGQHPNIEILTYSELISVSGHAGNFTAKIIKKARMVDLSLCIGCGICSDKCPSKVPSEFDAETTLRKAIYIPFPQAVPNKYLVDKDNCTYIQSDGKKCGNCLKVCLVENCINLYAKDEEIEINIGNIIVATGFKTFDAKRIERFGYGKYPNVLTSLELERLINASGPTGGKITFRSQDKKKNWVFSEESESPESVALIHCVGSRDENYNKYCSKVCCMYSLKLAHLVKEKLPDAIVDEYYIDMRAFGKGYEEFYERIKHEGINVIRGKTATIEQNNGYLNLRSEDIFNDRLIEQEYDMVVLAVGLEPRKDAAEIGKMLGIDQDTDGWFNEKNSMTDPVSTQAGGITIAGVCHGPKDIPDSVAQASAAAANVLQSIIRGKVKGGDRDFSFEKIANKVNELNLITEDKI